ncbi:hypothetical protein [Nocardioides sp.]|uniref:hypothetical protein n=1 Tax=Nocardioides sp. TaxID=35761 RepID=UPI00286C781D|nr:hypothetical protein [Nocardioides sp.]
MDIDTAQAAQAVVDRVTSYQESAPEGTVEKELRDGLTEAGVNLSDDDVRRLVDAIEGTDEGEGHVKVAEVLG